MQPRIKLVGGGMLQRIERKIDENAFIFVLVAAGMIFVIAAVLVYAICTEIPVFVRRRLIVRRSKRYWTKVQRIATLVKLPVMNSWTESKQYVTLLEEWCDCCGIKVYMLDGPLFQKLPVEGRVVVVDIRPSFEPNHLLFLTKADAALYRLAF
jgi:hypothetical protein